jgi:hypothetical protein
MSIKLENEETFSAHPHKMTKKNQAGRIRCDRLPNTDVCRKGTYNYQAGDDYWYC